MEHVRGWTARRKISVYLIAQGTLLGLIIAIVHTADADISTPAYIGPWLGAAVGGLIGILLASKRPTP
ncbi:hypothetical protein ACFYNY_20725 [Streptomyces sp. NPDC006530]|uniref:hypothetical protein n=1 Tax=Streptomyces sp. NPDC006530 TaxID=3364750 RepID=UPI0036904848